MENNYKQSLNEFIILKLKIIFVSFLIVAGLSFLEFFYTKSWSDISSFLLIVVAGVGFVNISIYLIMRLSMWASAKFFPERSFFFEPIENNQERFFNIMTVLLIISLITILGIAVKLGSYLMFLIAVVLTIFIYLFVKES